MTRGVWLSVEGGEDDAEAGHCDQVEAEDWEVSLKGSQVTGASGSPPVLLQVPGQGEQEEEDGRYERGVAVQADLVLQADLALLADIGDV